MITIYVDMDDTLCDFVGQSERDRLANPAIRFPQATYGFFRKLKPLPNAIDSVHELEKMGYDVWILTRPSVLNPMCYTDKRVWVEEHLGMEFCEKLILCPDKARVGDIGDYLIDDWCWEGFKGEQIHFGYGDTSTWKQVIEKFKNIKK